MNNECRWVIYDVYVATVKELEETIKQVRDFVSESRDNHRLGAFYFNRYLNQKKYVKLGFYDINEEAKKQLETLFRKLKEGGSIIDVRKNMPDLSNCGGIPRDAIKCLDYELFEIIEKRLGDKPTKEQMCYLIHLLMNQLGFNYQEELQVYESLTKNISSK